MIVESVGRLWRWVRDRQVVEVQRQMLDPKTHKTWYEYHTLIYNAQAKVVESEAVGTKFDKTV
jgi:hypothetical protein